MTKNERLKPLTPDQLRRVTGGSEDSAIELGETNPTIVSPRDPASGLPTGKRMHKPL
jgi:hypothetical protein